MSIDNNLVEAESEWQGRIQELQALIAQLEGEMVEAEGGLAEELAAINAFEFKLRVGVRQLMDRLDQLTEQIADLRKQLRWHYDFSAEEPGDWSFSSVEEAYYEPQLDFNDYRYHDGIPTPADGRLNQNQTSELKRLYRQLARRFHPDIGSGDEDRLLRTQMMMAINAAYAAGDLERLKELSLEPDLVDKNTLVNNDEQLVSFLLHELTRLQRRLSEIKNELASVKAKKNYRLMRQAIRAEENGQDWLAQMKGGLQEQLANKLVERDVLRQELELQEMISDEEKNSFQGDEFADAIWDISLEATFDVDPDLEAEAWLFRHKPDAYRQDVEDDELD